MQFRTAATRIVGAAEEVAAGVGLILVVVITLYNVVNRYVLQQSAAWAPELAEMLFAWVVFLGASAAWKRGMHISISVVVRQLHPRAQAFVRLLGDVILIGFLAYATFLAVKITISSHARVSPVMRVPFSYVYASAALCFALMLVRQVASAARSLATAGTPVHDP
jgi:TRAP-type C4-dicarboxylate transport system permease small subunit